MASQTAPVVVDLQSAGDENAIGFSLSFDPSVLTYSSASLGSDASQAVLNVNSSQAASGRLAFVLALPPGHTFAAGRWELLTALFKATAIGGTSPISLTDQVVPRELSDTHATALPCTYVNGSVELVSQNLKITLSQEHVTLSWLATGNPLSLQEAGTLTGAWSNRLDQPIVLNRQNTVRIPAQSTARFYRLFSP